MKTILVGLIYLINVCLIVSVFYIIDALFDKRHDRNKKSDKQVKFKSK